MYNIKNFYILLLFTIIILSLTFFLIYNFGSSVPYYEKNITDTFLLVDNPSLKNLSIFNDLSVSLIIFLSIFILIGYKFSKKIYTHIQLIWVIKCFTSFFLMLIFEYFNGLDQTSYFNFVINNSSYAHHFGNLDKYIDVKNSTVNFLTPLKIINFIFRDSWFVQKLFQNVLYLGVIILTYLTLIKLNYKFKNNIFIIYFISFIPTFFLFSSFITKDFIILFLISLIIHSIIKLKVDKKKNIIITTLLILFSIIFIYLLRPWIAYAILIALSLNLILIFLNKISNGMGLLHIFTILLISILWIFYGEVPGEILPEIYYSLFNRFSTEHFYPVSIYDTLFINAGEKIDIIKLAPKAIYKFFLNPFVGEIFILKYTIFSIENIVYFILFLFSIINLKKNEFEKIFFIIILFFILTCIYSLIGYLNTGTTLRYGMQAKLPLIIVLIFFNYNFFNQLNYYLFKFTSKIKIDKIN